MLYYTSVGSTVSRPHAVMMTDRPHMSEGGRFTGTRAMAKIIQFKKKRKTMSAEEYIDACNAVEQLVEEARPHQLAAARAVLHEIRFCAAFNAQFREETGKELLALVDDLYAEAEGYS